MAPCSITTLPDDVLFRVFALCNGDDLRAFAEVSRNFRIVAQDDFLWRVIYRRRFGEEPDSRAQSYQEQYNDRDCLILSIAYNCKIAHSHPPYWRFSTDSRSVFGTVALLNAVSWLHVQGCLQGVHAGKYRVIWRLFVLPRAQNIFGIMFRAKAAQRRTIESQLPHNTSLLDFGSDYFDFVIPDVLVVKAPFEDVLFECICTSREWKTNIALCSVRLEPVGNSSRAHRAREIVSYRSKTADKERVERQLRRLGNSRVQPGTTYRLWQPWSTVGWAESSFMALFCLLLAVLFAYILFDRTRS